MTRLKFITFVGLLIWMVSCKDDPYEALPVIRLTEIENKKFTYTNKISGFYVGNSHQENESDDHGWTVNENHYIKDYRINSGQVQITRDSLNQFSYYPFSFIRNYNFPIKETFTLLDSINVIIWEFESTSELDNFSFQPLPHYDHSEKTKVLTPTLTQIIYSPEEINSEQIEIDVNWLGFRYLTKGNNKVVIIGALESSKKRLLSLLDALSINFESKKEEKIHRLTSLLELNNTYTNLPEITEAIAWSQISLDALITRQRGKGICTGLPGSNKYRGRDSFISFAGAFLVNGNFDEAREVLEYFSRFQLENDADTWDGRIPNQVNNKEIIYDTADNTWWFIREAYEYLLYNSDTSFVHQIYPVIKRAIKGAIRHRIDENFFLIHDDADTWMDAKGPAGALSPRGNRAIEIQALWYTSLQIGSKFARLKNEDQLAEHWLAISHTLRKNFVKKYWSSVKKQAYDHLDEDGFPDRKVRPNQIFAVHIPLLPGIESLLSQDRCARITSNVVHKLTYRYGVASLWQEDTNFHPWYSHSADYHKDEAYHNGTVWTWLAGPVISSLLLFNRHELAFNLYYDMAIQILQDDAIGNLAELRDAVPRRGFGEPLISGSISHAQSLAEYARNFYQDIVGYRPNAPEKKINISPKIPGDLQYISTTLPYQNSSISLTYNAEEEGYKFEFYFANAESNVDVSFFFPGYDPVEFRLEEENSSFELSLKYSNQRSYHLYQELDWYFAQPKLIQDVEIFQTKE
jgi:glycogen debranching enzyme